MTNRILFALLVCVPVVQAWSSGQQQQQRHTPPLSSLAPTTTDPILSRRQVGGWSAGFLSAALASTTLLYPTAAGAKEEAGPPPTALEIQKALQPVKNELQGPGAAAGGIPYIQECIDKEDYPALMEFTRNYDLDLRKIAMGKAAKVMAGVYEDEKEKKEFSNTATLMKNAVTWDLIGINKASRPGQENKEQAAKYLGELKVDIQTFLELEQKSLGLVKQ
jgi:hypothetical protein